MKINNLTYGSEIYIDGVIGVDFTLKDLIDNTKAIKSKPLTVYINSPGGLVTEGMAIRHYLKEHFPDVTTYNLGLCASIASIIFLAGKERVSPKNAFYMIHKPWTMAMGNSNDLQKDIDLLNKMENELINIYLENSAHTADEIKQMLEDETWLNGDEAFMSGFVTKVVDAVEVAACADLSKFEFKKAPEAIVIKKEEEAVVEQSLFKDEKEIPQMENNIQNKIDLTEIVMSQSDNGLSEIKNILVSKPQNATLTLSDGYGVPTAVGGDILRVRNKKSIFRSAGIRNVKVSTLTSVTYNPNTTPAGVITGNYGDIGTNGTILTLVPKKVGGRYQAKEEVNDFSVLNVLDNFKQDAAQAVIKGENKLIMDAIIATNGVGNVASGAWTQAKIAEVYAAQGADYLGTPGAWFINSASLGALMAVQTNGAGSPLLFQPVFESEDGRVGMLLGQPVYVHASIPTATTGTKKALWYVAMDAVVLADFNGGNFEANAGMDQNSNDLFINFREYVDYQVADATGIVTLTWA